MRQNFQKMRTTVDLPQDLHRMATAIARDTGRSLSETVVELVRRGLAVGERGRISTSAVTGLPVIDLGQVVTSEEVRSLEDDIP